MKYLLPLLLTILCLVPHAMGQSDSTHTIVPSIGAQYIEQSDYAGAARQYSAALEANPSASLYHNLGVTYGLMEQYPRAILAYERALMLNPFQRETRHNLRLSYRKIKDAPDAGHSFPLLDDIAYGLSDTTLGVLSLVLFVIFIALLILFRIGATILVRKVSFYSSFGILVLWLGVNALLLHQWYYHRVGQTRAIVLTTTPLLSSAEADATEIVVLNAGSPVFLMSNTSSDLSAVRLSDGRHGYVQSSAIEPVIQRHEAKP